jgi:hypothetical protein
MVDFAPGVFPIFCSAPRARHSERNEEGPRGEWLCVGAQVFFLSQVFLLSL